MEFLRVASSSTLYRNAIPSTVRTCRFVTRKETATPQPSTYLLPYGDFPLVTCECSVLCRRTFPATRVTVCGDHKLAKLKRRRMEEKRKRKTPNSASANTCAAKWDHLKKKKMQLRSPPVTRRWENGNSTCVLSTRNTGVGWGWNWDTNSHNATLPPEKGVLCTSYRTVQEIGWLRRRWRSDAQ